MLLVYSQLGCVCPALICMYPVALCQDWDKWTGNSEKGHTPNRQRGTLPTTGTLFFTFFHNVLRRSEIKLLLPLNTQRGRVYSYIYYLFEPFPRGQFVAKRSQQAGQCGDLRVFFPAFYEVNRRKWYVSHRAKLAKRQTAFFALFLYVFAPIFHAAKIQKKSATQSAADRAQTARAGSVWCYLSPSSRAACCKSVSQGT